MGTPLDNKSFLIVDDFGDMRAVLKGMLNTFGVTSIDTAKNGADAVRLLESNRYDVVLCDYNLGPGKDGQQVLEEARHRRLIDVSTLFLMITAENTREMVLGAIEYEPDGYLSKPFSKDLLRSRLERLLVKKQGLKFIDAAVNRGDYGQAIRLLDQRIHGRSGNVQGLTRLRADLCYRAGDYDTAAAIYEEVLATRQIAWATLGLGKVLYARHRYSEARKVFEGLACSGLPIAPAYDWLARTHRVLGEFQQAQEVLSAGVSISPKAVLRQTALGEVALQNKDFESAAQAFGNAVDLAKHSVYRHPRLYAKLVEAQLAGGDRAKEETALGVIRRMEQEFGTDEQARCYAALSEARVRAALGDPEAAQQCLDQAGRLHERPGAQGDGALTLEMARICARLGAAQQAAALFEDAITNHCDDDLFLREVEAAYSESGLPDSPRQRITQIPKDPGKARVEEQLHRLAADL